MQLRSDILILQTCPVCGRKFYKIHNGVWGWKIKRKIFCSYHCMREYEKPILEKKDAAMRRKIEKAEACYEQY